MRNLIRKSLPAGQVLLNGGQALWRTIARQSVPNLCVWLIVSLFILILLAWNLSWSFLVPYLAGGILPVAFWGAVYMTIIRPGRY